MEPSSSTWARSWRAWRARWASRWSGSSVGGGVEERVERHLGVDHDRPLAGEADDEVGPQGAVGAVVQVDLLEEVAAVDQAGQLDGPAQVELAPASAHLGPAQRGRQGLGLAAQAVGGQPHVEHLLVELALPGGARVVEVVELVAEPVEALHHSRGQAWSTMPCPSPSTYAGRERAQSTPTAAPSASPTRSIRSADIMSIRARVPGTTDNSG